jgi:hypothetical protein
MLSLQLLRRRVAEAQWRCLALAALPGVKRELARPGCVEQLQVGGLLRNELRESGKERRRV